MAVFTPKANQTFKQRVRVVYSLVFYVVSVCLFVFFIFSHGVVSYFRLMSLTVPLVPFVPLLKRIIWKLYSYDTKFRSLRITYFGINIDLLTAI